VTKYFTEKKNYLVMLPDTQIIHTVHLNLLQENLIF